MNFIEGEVLYIDKPLGWTSFDAVKRIRGALTRRLGVKKSKSAMPAHWTRWPPE